MIKIALTVLSEFASGVLRFGLDRLGGKDSGGLPIESAHPYGLRSRPRDPDKDPDGNPTKGAAMVLIEQGGGDEWGFPGQDPRITTLPDEGKGGVLLYGWTGQTVAHVRIDGPTGAIVITPAAGQVVRLDGTSEVGGSGGAAIARAPELQTRAAAQDAFNAAVSAALVALGQSAPPVVPPLASSVAATKGTVV